MDRLLPQELETTNASQRLGLLGKLLGIEGGEVPYRPLYTHDAFLALSERFAFPTFSAWSSVYTPWAMDVKLAH